MSRLFRINFNGTQIKINFLGLRLSLRKAKIPFVNFCCRRENVRLQKRNLTLGRSQLAGKEAQLGKFLFVTDSLVCHGGVENRLLQYAGRLSRSGYAVHFFTSEPIALPEFADYPQYRLYYPAKNFNRFFLDLVQTEKIDVVEFHFKSDECLRSLDIASLKKLALTGCTIHGIGNYLWEYVNQLHYRIFISQGLYASHKELAADGYIVKNAVEKQSRLWRYQGQDRAIHISRLTSDKLSLAETFVRYCLDRGLKFEIAGAPEPDFDFKRRLMRRFKLKEDPFIGEIDTIRFLAEHRDRYLFVAGVGLVAIEAGTLNYPVFLTSPKGVEDSTFLTKQNYPFFTDTNFTLSLYAARRPIVKTLETSRIGDLELGQYFSRDRDIDTVFQDYLEMIRRGLREKRGRNED